MTRSSMTVSLRKWYYADEDGVLKKLGGRYENTATLIEQVNMQQRTKDYVSVTLDQPQKGGRIHTVRTTGNSKCKDLVILLPGDLNYPASKPRSKWRGL